MATEKEYQGLYDRIAALREQVTSKLSADLISNPQLADALTKQIDDMLASVVDADAKTTPPPDKGLAQLAGIGPEAGSLVHRGGGSPPHRRTRAARSDERRLQQSFSMREPCSPSGSGKTSVQICGASSRHGAAVRWSGRICPLPV